jgi:hypothetical protein
VTPATATKSVSAGLLLTVAAAIVVGVGRDGPAAAAPPLSRDDLSTLAADAALIESLPHAFAEVPKAASDATAGHFAPARARRIIAATPGLRPLSDAIGAPDSVTGELTGAFQAVLGSRDVSNPEQLPAALGRLQAVQGEIVPALRLVAARSGRPLAAADALSVIEADRRTPAVAALVGRWPQVYGAFVLIEQAVA